MPKSEKKLFPIKTVIISSVSGAAVFYFLVYLFSLLILKSSDNHPMLILYGIISAAVSSFVSSFTALKFIKEKGIFHGAVIGFVQYIICSSVMLILNNGATGFGMLILFGIIMLMSCAGGLAGVSLKKKIKY